MGLLISSNQHAGYDAARGCPREIMGFAPLVRKGYVVTFAPRHGRLRPDGLIRQYGHSFCDPIGCQRNDAALVGLESAAKRLDLETERQRQKRNVSAANVRNVFSPTWWGPITICRCRSRPVQRIGSELHAVRCFSIELQACSASANVVKGEPAILIALRLR